MKKLFVAAINVGLAKVTEMVIAWYIPIIFIREGGFKAWGEITYALTINLALVAILLLGADVLIQRLFVDRGYTKRVLYDIYKLETVSIAVSAMVILVVVIADPYPNSYFILALPPLLINSYNAEHFRAIMSTRIYLLVTMMPSILFAVSLAAWRLEVSNYLYACAIAAFISTILQQHLMRVRKIRLNPVSIIYRNLVGYNKFFGVRMRHILGESLRITKGGMAIILSKYSDIAILGMFVSTGMLGKYDIALKITMLISAPLAMIAPFIIPVLRKIKPEQQKNKFYMMQAFSGISALIIALVIFSAEPILEWLIISNIADIWPLIYILAAGQMVNSMTGPSGMVLLANDMTRDWTRIVTYNFVLGVPIFFILVKWFGVYGAASVNAASLIVINLAMYYAVHTFYKSK